MTVFNIFVLVYDGWLSTNWISAWGHPSPTTAREKKDTNKKRMLSVLWTSYEYMISVQLCIVKLE